MPSVEHSSDSRLDPRAPALTRIAHRLAAKPHRCIALVPASAGMRLHPVAVALGLELASLEHCNVAVVTPDVSALSGGGVFDSGHGVFGRWIASKTVVLVPPVDSVDAGVVSGLGSAIAYAKQHCTRVVVDASPVADRSERLAVTRWADGVCAVARARVTKELELLRVQGDILEDRNLGVLLIEG